MTSGIETIPWWIGGPVLGGVVVLHLVLMGRLLSVSGLFTSNVAFFAGPSMATRLCRKFRPAPYLFM